MQQRTVSYEGICVLHIYQSDSRRQGYRGSNITTYSLMAYTATDHYPSQHSTAQHNTTLRCTAPCCMATPSVPALHWLDCSVKCVGG